MSDDEKMIPHEAFGRAERAREEFIKYHGYPLSHPHLIVRAQLEAAAPVIVAADRKALADDLERQAGVFGDPHDSTAGAGMVAALLDIARELRQSAAELLEGGQVNGQ